MFQEYSKRIMNRLPLNSLLQLREMKRDGILF